MKESKISYRIRSEDSGIRLDQFLPKKFGYLTRSKWQEKIRTNLIFVNGENKNGSYKLKQGEDVLYVLDEFFEPEVNKNVSILFEDEYFYAFYKPADLPMHKSGRYLNQNLIEVLKEKLNIEVSFLLNRLDRETSGIVLVSKTKEFAREMNFLFKNKKIQKTYLVVVEGDFPKKIVAEGKLVNDLESKIRKKRKFITDLNLDKTSPDYCLTRFKKITSIKNYSFVLCFPITGRTHQIRASLLSLGFPVVGDKIYGIDENIYLDFIQGKELDLKSTLGLERQALHSWKIRFHHPVTKKRVFIKAEIPSEFYLL